MKIIIYLVLAISFLSCTIWKESLISNGGQNEAISNAITDFMCSCELRKTDSIFSVYTYLNNENVLGVSISKNSENKVYPTLNDKIGSYSKIIPSRYKLVDNKLFYWDDLIYQINQDIIDVLSKYNHIDSLMIDSADFYVFPPYYLDELTKAAHYYFCKDDLREYKRVVTNRGMGTYPPPKLKCISLIEKQEENDSFGHNPVEGSYKIFRIKEKDMCHVIYAQKGDSCFKILSEKQYFRIPEGYRIKKGESYNLELELLDPSNYNHKKYQIYYFKSGGFVRFKGKLRQKVYLAKNLDGLYVNE